MLESYLEGPIEAFSKNKSNTGGSTKGEAVFELLEGLWLAQVRFIFINMHLPLFSLSPHYQIIFFFFSIYV
jgi:hypothetical protein